MKIMTIKDCFTCPYLEGVKGHGYLGTKMGCNKMDSKLIPRPVNIIPEWCPLEDK